MSSLTKIIKSQCRFDKKIIKWNHDSSQQVHAKTAYNAALSEIISFIERYEDGKVEKEHVEHILKNYKD